MSGEWLALVESNTTGSGRLFCAAARQLGLRPVLIARNPGRYPYLQSVGIDVQVADTADAGAVRAACTGLAGPVAGVTSSSEYYIATAAQVARSLGLPHPDPGSVRACRDKSIQRARLEAAGLACPAFASARTAREAATAAARIGLPVVVKPVAGSGSVDTRLCASPDEAAEAAAVVLGGHADATSLPRQHAVMVEEYLAGPEYSVEMLDGMVVGVARKHLGAEPYFVETGHDFPAPLPEAERADIGRAAVAALRALGLGWGGAHVELRRTADGFRIVEVNPRLAGGMIPQLVQEALGVDMISHVVAGAAGRSRPPEPIRAAAAAIRFLVAREPGLLAGVHGAEHARGLPGVVAVGLTCETGREVRLPQSFQDRLGYVIAAAATVTGAARAAEDGLRALDVRVTPASGTGPGAAGQPGRSGARVAQY
jgi:biotin carboxylase